MWAHNDAFLSLSLFLSAVHNNNNLGLKASGDVFVITIGNRIQNVRVFAWMMVVCIENTWQRVLADASAADCGDAIWPDCAISLNLYNNNNNNCRPGKYIIVVPICIETRRRWKPDADPIYRDYGYNIM